MQEATQPETEKQGQDGPATNDEGADLGVGVLVDAVGPVLADGLAGPVLRNIDMLCFHSLALLLKIC